MMEFEQFGYSFDLSNQTGQPMIAISSLTRDSKLNSQFALELNKSGIVQIFKINILNNSLSLLSTLKSDRPYSGFGSKIKVRNVLMEFS